MHTADKPRIFGDMDVGLCAQGFADRGGVERGGKDASVGATLCTATSAAIVSGFVWIVSAARSVSCDQDDRSKVGGESHDTQDALDTGQEFVVRKTFCFEGVCVVGLEDGHLGLDGGQEALFQGLFEFFGFSWGEDAQEHRDEVEESENKRPEESAQRHPTVDEALALEPPKKTAFAQEFFEGLMLFFGVGLWAFADFVFGKEDGRAKCSIIGILEAFVFHVDAKEARDTEGFALWVDLFKMASKGFFAIIDTTGDLKGGALCLRGEGIVLCDVFAQSIEDALIIVSFVSEVPDPRALVFIESCDVLIDVLKLFLGGMGKFVGGDAGV